MDMCLAVPKYNLFFFLSNLISRVKMPSVEELDKAENFLATRLEGANITEKYGSASAIL